MSLKASVEPVMSMIAVTGLSPYGVRLTTKKDAPPNFVSKAEA
jgi:hypothetical protein